MRLVTAIMPTRGRPELSQRALASFLAQTYQDRELVILDDENDRSFQSPPDHPMVRYELSDERMVPRKRNRCCELARGGTICHFDSDDYSTPDRIESELRFLDSSGLSVAGYNELLFWDSAAKRAFKYKSPRVGYICGTSLMYRRFWWEQYPFNPNRAINSDGEFQLWPRHKHELAIESGLGKIVATIHSGNMSQVTPNSVWDCINRNVPNISLTPAESSAIPKEFFNAERTPDRQGHIGNVSDHEDIRTER